MTFFADQLYNSVALAAVYVGVGIGITLLYAITGLLNFSQAQLLTLGGFATYAFTKAGLPFAVAVLLAAVSIAVGFELVDLAIFRPTLNRPLNGFVVTLGLVAAMQAAFVLIWGT